MQKRIYFNFLGLILISVTLLAASFSFFLLNATQDQEIAAIKDKAYLIANVLNYGFAMEGASHFSDYLMDTDGSRITLIAPDGSVLLDSHAQAERLENRSNRAEFIQALYEGSGEAIRYSTIFNSETYYYAVRLQDNNVLRISRTINSLGQIFTAVLPALITVTLFVLLLAHFIAKHLTRKIIRPLSAIDLENTIDIYSDSFYEELLPFIKKINRQKTEQHNAETQRREFSANVSHELKTPLTTISALSEMMAGGMAKPEDFANFATKISTQAKRLINIIDDIIRLSEFDENKADREYTPFDVHELAKSIIAALHEKAAEKNISLNLKGQPMQMTANNRLIDELLYNLIDNAIKYNKKDGQVTIELHGTKGHHKITITDTGIGIPQEHQGRIFERFFRADNSRSKKTGGTGLGLSIVKHIVAHHHGEIELKSAEGLGTSIECSFPV